MTREELIIRIRKLAPEVVNSRKQAVENFNEKLIKAARDHSQDMKEKDFQGHTGSNGSVLSGRLDNFNPQIPPIHSLTKLPVASK